jgi:hypothetical protein
MEIPTGKEVLRSTVGFLFGYFATLAWISYICDKPFDPAGELRTIGLYFLGFLPGSNEVVPDDR